MQRHEISPVTEAIESEPRPKRGGCSCILGEYIAILLLIGVVTIIALLTLGGGWGEFISAVGASPHPSALP